jgi:TolB protein
MHAALARFVLAGTVLGLGACGTSGTYAERPTDQPATASKPQQASSETSRAFQNAGDVATAEPEIATTAPAVAPAPIAEALPAIPERRLAPMPVIAKRDRFDETGPASVDGLSQVSFAQEGEDFDPVLTPDGEKMIFASTQYRTTSDIYAKPVKGSVVTQLTSDPADDVMPTVSPDGKKVAFASNRSGSWNIYVMPITGGRPVQVTATGAHDLHPSWSPDGKHLVFSRLGEVSHRWEMWVTDASNPSASHFVGYGLLPEWCPVAGTGENGADRILFQLPRERGARTFGVWTIDFKDGVTSNAMAIATSGGSALINPTWSPDGKFIAYAEVPAPEGRVEINQSRPGQSDLWMAAVDGSARVKLTDGNAVALMPHWGANNRMVFFSDRAGRGNVWTMDVNNAVLACGGSTGVEHAAATNDAPAQAAAEETEQPAEQK